MVDQILGYFARLNQIVTTVGARLYRSMLGIKWDMFNCCAIELQICQQCVVNWNEHMEITERIMRNELI